jgi:transcriptional regulator with XRE-family HTH domain
MHPITHIRKNVLRLNQASLADLVGVTQATVSRWESGELEPSREELGKIRDEARARGLAWDDRWFFEAPTIAPGAPEQEHVA